MKAKKLFAGIFLLLVVVILFFLWNQPRQKTNHNLINTTGKETAQPDVAKQEKKPAKKERKPELEVTPVTEWEAPVISELAKERSYLNVYADLKFAKRCEDYYQTEHEQKNAFDVRDYFNARFLNPMLVTEQPTEIQINSFHKFLQACDGLKKATFLRANIDKRYPKTTSPYLVTTELEKELEMTQAVNKEELSLKEALRLKKQWHQLLDDLISASTGPLVMSEAELAEARDELMQLSQQMVAVTNNGEDIDPETMNNIMEQIRELRNAMEATQGGDEETRKQLLNELLQIEQNLLKLLQSPYLETFLTAMSTLEFSGTFDLRVTAEFSKHKFQNVMKHIPEYVSPSQVLRELSKAPDDSYYDVLVQPASYLYLCKRGHDCSETSELITDFCWGSLNKIKLLTSQLHPEACGLDVKTFILEHFLTKNQKTDVLALLQLMEEQYAL